MDFLSQPPWLELRLQIPDKEDGGVVQGGVVSCGKQTYLVVLVDLIHAALTFLLSNDFAGVLHNNLAGLKTPAGPYAKAARACVDNLDTHAIAAALLVTVLQVLEGPVLAVLAADVAVCVVALVQD